MDRQLLQAAGVTTVGLAHFACPTVFEPLNRRLGFTTNTRRHVYVNGAIEIAIGLSSAKSQTHPLATALGTAYEVYLVGGSLRAGHATRRV